VNLKEWAELQGVAYITARRQYAAGTLPVPTYPSLLRDPAVATIVVEHRDRFARLGAEYVEAALTAQGRRLLVVDPSEVDDDLVRRLR
jgi:predicted site-specific integrase-resolvase